jgi:hypothetical protein
MAEFKKGDIVLIIHSYGGGKRLVGSIATFIRYTEEPYALKNDSPHMVNIGTDISIFCRAVAPTELLKALL